ncbi:MAG: hypothetical protein ABR511_03495 [Acidimicrobiales bacterium]
MRHAGPNANPLAMFEVMAVDQARLVASAGDRPEVPPSAVDAYRFAMSENPECNLCGLLGPFEEAPS